MNFDLMDSRFCDRSVVSLGIGKFDAMHLAHIVICQNLLGVGGLICIDSFDKRILCSRADRKSLVNLKVFYLNLEDVRYLTGLDFILFLKRHFRSLKYIVVGYDFCFGVNRSCGISDLKSFCDIARIHLIVVPEVRYRGISVHSSVIKESLRRGYLRTVIKLLNRVYTIKGRVIRGQGIGSKKLFPTINLECSPYFLPKQGVYAITLSGFLAAGFVGIRSTDLTFSVEAYVLQTGFFKQKSYKRGDVLEIGFLRYIRENQRFEDLADLKNQIEIDVEKISKLPPSIFI